MPEPPEPDDGSREGDSPKGPPLGGAREPVAEFRVTFAGVLEDCPTRLDGYRVLLDEARTLGAEHAGLSPRLGSALAHEVLADALGHYLSIGPDVLPRAFRGANALSGDDGLYWWILAVQDAAGRDITPGHRSVRWIRWTRPPPHSPEMRQGFLAERSLGNPVVLARLVPP